MSQPEKPAAGITPNAQKEETEEHYEGHWWGVPPMRNALGSGVLLVLGFASSRIGSIPEWVSISFYVAAIPLGASHWGREALEAVFKLRVNIDTLMAVSST